MLPVPSTDFLEEQSELCASLCPFISSIGMFMILGEMTLKSYISRNRRRGRSLQGARLRFPFPLRNGKKGPKIHFMWKKGNGKMQRGCKSDWFLA